MNKPKIFLKNDLLNPVLLLKNNLIAFKEELEQTDSVVVQRSLFVYVVASFEIMLTDLLTFYLNVFPEKIENKNDFTIQKNDLIHNSFTSPILEMEVEKYVHDLSYKNIHDFLKKTCSILSLNTFDEDLIDKLQERKATRNLLIHNNLKYNSVYHGCAGNFRREADYHGFLPLEKGYIVDTLNLVEEICNIVYSQLDEKYNNYTKYNALKNLWNYIFASPILKFEDYWDSNIATGITFKLNIRKFKSLIADSYSGTETAFLALWMTHFNSYFANKVFSMLNINTFSFDDTSKEKYLYLLSVIENYPEIFKTP